ncbi:MAG TPA: hypothetical protein VM389_03465 [Phycisphaerae bacterium]|nr:hypothetical protein [Phycisphaerae bacterium]
MHAPARFLTALSLLLVAAACQGGVEVWATGDGVRVNPVTGKYMEDRVDIHKDYPTGDYRKSNPVWDAEAKKVTLHAARNEFAAFQLVVARGEKDPPQYDLTVAMDKLTGPDGATIEGPNIALLKAWYMDVLWHSSGYQNTSLGVGWYADALVPPPSGRSLTFDLPDATNTVGHLQRNQTVWVDLFVPRDRKQAPPGAYKGELTVSWKERDAEWKLVTRTVAVAVELNVWDFALPEEIHCKGDIWNGSLAQMPPEQELQWYQMLHRHRLQPGVCYYRPELKVEGTKVTIDWTDYDKRVTKYLDGTAFTAECGYWGPGQGEPIEHILLPFHDKNWPISMPKDGPNEDFEAVWVETAKQVKAHFDADPRRKKVRKVVFLGGLDESYNEKAYEKMRYYCDLIRKGIGKGWFQFRIDGGYSWKAMDTLKDHVDLWVCHTIGFDKEKMAHFRALGVEPWFYGPMVYERRGNSACGSNTFTDTDLLTGRGVGWVAWKYNCGYCQWEFDAVFHDAKKIWKRRQAGDADWWEAMNVSYGNNKYNGSGLLVFRGTEKMTGHTGPVATIRLKAHRRGFQDYEYFWLLKQAGKAAEADKMVNSVVHADPFGQAAVGNVELWKNNPEAWDAVRIQAGEMLHAMAKKP